MNEVNETHLGQLSRKHGITHEGFIDIGGRSFMLLRVGPWYHAFEPADLSNKGLTHRNLEMLMQRIDERVKPRVQLPLF